MAFAVSERNSVVATCQFVTAPWAIKRADRAQQQQGRGPLVGGGVRSSPLVDAAQGDQRKTTVNSNNYSSGRAFDDENVDNDNNGSGGGGPASMIKDEDNLAGVATGGNDKGNCLCSHLICDKGIGQGAGIRRSIHSECIVT